MFIAYNKLTDDFEKIETDEKDMIGDKFVVRPIDYLMMIVGARDYNYLMHENKNMLDNEVTSLYPLVSYPMLQFILFMLSFKNPYVSYLFKFRKDKLNGIHSEVFSKTINELIYKKYPVPRSVDYNHNTNHSKLNKGFNFFYSDDKKYLTYNMSDRPFTYLALPTKFILNSDLKYNETLGDPKYIELLCKRTKMMMTPLYAPKLKLAYFLDLEFILKNDVMEYIPRFYYNRYSQYYDRLIKRGIFGNNKFMNSSENLTNEFVRQEFISYMSRTDLNKMNINIEVDDRLVDAYIFNKMMLDKKLGVESESREKMMEGLFYKLKGDYRHKPIDNIDELYEFYIKSILIRRSPKSRINTLLNRTNGVYLLHTGVSRFRELLNMEMLYHRKIIDDNVVMVTNRSVEVRYNGKKTRLKFSNVVDLDNKPFLLSDRMMKLIDAIYGNKYELHGLVKYAEIYCRLFNQFGNNVIWFILGTELEKYTGYNHDKYIAYKGMGKRQPRWYTFFNFEKMLEKRQPMDFLFKKLKHSHFYTRKREDRVRTKFILFD